MKRFNSVFTNVPMVITLVALTGCTDGLSGPSSTFEANSSGTSLTSGIVSTDTGLSVGGQVVPLQSVAVSIDGEPAAATALQDGMRVTIEQQDGVIKTISYDEDVKGPIDNVELDGSLSVLGQIVHISPGTYFDDSAPGTLNGGDVIEVSGLRDSNGALAASRIELKKSNTTSWSVRGQIRDLDRKLQVFRIGNLTVDYTQARFDDMSESALVNGLQVEAKDESRTYEPGSLYLMATKIENQDPAVRYPFSTSFGVNSSTDDSNTLSIDDSSSNGVDSAGRTEVEIDGLVTGFDPAAGTLKVEGIEITTSGETEYQDEYDQYLTRAAFFARLRQGVTVVKVKWRPFTGYDQPPRELELES